MLLIWKTAPRYRYHPFGWSSSQALSSRLDVSGQSWQVSDVKARVQAEKGDNFPAANQVLIFQGKVASRRYCSAAWVLPVSNVIALQVLKDETTLGENQVSENGFMVVMVTKVLVLLLLPLVARFLVIDY